VEAGTRLAIVGPRCVVIFVGTLEKLITLRCSGSGKSTTFKLLTRLYDPSEGRVCIDGVDIREYTLDSLRPNIGVIPQDTILFDHTVDFNIRCASKLLHHAQGLTSAHLCRYGNLSATREQVTAALKDSGLEKSITKLELGACPFSVDISGVAEPGL
jgi:ABC-type multidrug transport system fused ATPase/permease subunit